MLNVHLTYNPYSVDTKISIDGTPIPEDHQLSALCRSQRLHNWIDRFFEELLESEREPEISLTFKGTQLDAEDVENACKSFQERDEKAIVKLETDICHVPPERKISQLKTLFKKAQKGPFDEFRSERLQKLFDQALDPCFDVNVVATMSSGKSTVVNSMLGKALMPAKNEACTATIARIEDHDDMDGFQARRFGTDGHLLDDWRKASQDLLTTWNDDEETSSMEIQGNIPAVAEKENVRLVFVDTPGPNNSRDMEHRKRTVNAITNKPLSMVLYVLNATQLSTDDDRSLLDLVSDAMNTGGRQAQDRFIFIANKIDNFDPEQGEDVGAALDNTRRYLQNNGIENPMIIPASAELAKLVRLCRLEGEDTLSRRQRGDMKSFVELFSEVPEMNMLEHVKGSVNRACYENLCQRVGTAATPEEKAEIFSGIPIVEELFDEFLAKHAIPAKVKDAVDTFSHVMHKAEGLQKLNAQISKDQEALEAAVTALENFEKSQERISAAQEFRKRVKSLKYKPSQQLKNTYKGIQKKMYMLLEDLNEDFMEDVDPTKAQRVFKRATRKCTMFITDTEEVISKSLEDDFLGGLNTLRDEYQEHVQQLLQREFPSESDVELKSFQASAMQMPDIKSLIEESTYEEKRAVGSYQVSDSTWWKPWTWGRKRTVTDYECEEKVDMSEPWQEVENSLTATIQDNINNSNKQAEIQAEHGKKMLLKAMDDIDNVMAENLEQMKKAKEDRHEAERTIAENKSKIAWYQNFKQELDAVLALEE